MQDPERGDESRDTPEEIKKGKHSFDLVLPFSAPRAGLEPASRPVGITVAFF